MNNEFNIDKVPFIVNNDFNFFRPLLLYSLIPDNSKKLDFIGRIILKQVLMKYGNQTYL